jgi:endoglucanase
MTRSRRQFLYVSLALGVGTATNRAFAQKAQTQNGFVKTRGKDLISPASEKLNLHGINLGNWLQPEGYMFLFEGGPQSPREIEAFFTELIGPSAAVEFWKEHQVGISRKAMF